MELSNSAKKILEILTKCEAPFGTGLLKSKVGLRSPTSMNRALRKLEENELIDRKRGGWIITPEGRAELAKTEDLMFIRKQAKYSTQLLHLRVGADDFGQYYSELASPLTVFMPVPTAIHASLGASKEVSEEFDIVLPEYFYGIYPSQAWTLQSVIGEAASNIVNSLIWARVTELVGRHRRRPKTLNPENLLDFNVSFTVRFEGKKTLRDLHSRGVEYDRIKHRLVAMLLLTIAHIRQGGVSNFTVLDRMTEGGLLEMEEGRELKRVYSQVYSERRSPFGSRVEESGILSWVNHLDRIFHKAVARHLLLGGAVECVNTLESGRKCGNHLDWKLEEEQEVLVCRKCKAEYGLKQDEPTIYRT